MEEVFSITKRKNMKVILLTENSKEKAYYTMEMAMYTKEVLKIMQKMVKENYYSPIIWSKAIKETLSKIDSRAKVKLFTQMRISTKGLLRQIKSMVKGNTLLPRASWCSKDNG